MTKKKGKLTVVYGPMFSGKTTELIEVYGEGRGAVVFKPNLDKRYTKRPAVVTHDASEIPAVLIDHRRPKELLALVNGVQKVMIDEANFFTDDLIEVVEELSGRGIDVFVDGLVLDSERKEWGPVKKLIELADEAMEMFAKCEAEGCGEKASLSYCKKSKKDQVKVAGNEQYGACCEKHYVELHKVPVT